MSIGFTTSKPSKIEIAGEARGMGFHVATVGRTEVSDSKERVYCTSLITAYATRYAVQNSRGRFGRPGLVAPLVLK